MLEIKNIYAGYEEGKYVLQNFSLHIAPAERVGIVGQNGCGKSTLAKTIMGLVPYTQGSILWRGEELLGTPAHLRVSRQIACFMQGGKVFKNLTVQENIQFALLNTATTYEQALARLQSYDMEFFADRQRMRLLAANLSGGEKHLLAFAMTLLACPDAKMLIADEPSAGVDEATQKKLLNVLDNYLKTDQTAMLMIEHNLNFLEKLTDKKIEININANE